MSGPKGSPNAMRWNCETQGCFNKKRRPKIEVFWDCLPGNIGFGDIDGTVEINDHYLDLEWKGHAGEIPVGQRIMFERKTAGSGRFTVFVIVGCAETMVIESVCVFYRGRASGLEPSSLDDVKARIRRWVTWAKSRSAA